MLWTVTHEIKAEDGNHVLALIVTADSASDAYARFVDLTVGTRSITPEGAVVSAGINVDAAVAGIFNHVLVERLEEEALRGIPVELFGHFKVQL